MGQRWVERVVVAVSALSLALAGAYPGSEPDTFGHLAQGRQIVELGRVPRVDTWSLSFAGRSFPNYEWLSDLGTYGLYTWGGYPAITLFKCGLLLLTALALLALARTLTGPRGSISTGLLIVAVIPASRFRLSDRPHVLGLAFAALTLLVLTWLTTRNERRHRTASVMALAALHVVWVNAHGSHLLGVAISACFCVLGPAALRRTYFALLGLQAVASAVSPYGPAIVADALAHVFDGRYRTLVSEWRAWREDDPAWLQLSPVLTAVALTLSAPTLVRRLPLSRPTLVVSALLAFASFRSIRFVAEFSLLSAPLLGCALACWSARLELRTRTLLLCAACGLLGVLVPLGSSALPPLLPLGLGTTYRRLPQASGLVLARHGRAPRVFAAIEDSWFLMFRAPSARHVMDGRVPFYGPEHAAKVARALGEHASFEALVRELAVDSVVAGIAKTDNQKLAGFAERSGFTLRLIEDEHALYTREGALTPAGARAFPPLLVLRPSYTVGWVLEPALRASADLKSELARLATLPGTAAYRGWVEAVSVLAPLRRGGGSDGFRWPHTEAERTRYRRALAPLLKTAAVVGRIPAVAALEATVAASLCELELAEEALARALEAGASREPLLAAQEVALRRGRVDEVRSVLTEVSRLPQAAGDPWLRELREGLTDPPRCPE